MKKNNKDIFFASSEHKYERLILKLHTNYDVDKLFEHAKIRYPELYVEALFNINSESKKYACQKYGLDRYYKVTLPITLQKNNIYINEVLRAIEQWDIVESIYPQCENISANKIKNIYDVPEIEFDTRENKVTPPSFHHMQYYAKSPNDRKEGYRLGGVNANAAATYLGGYGENITIISNEISAWDTNHINLPSSREPVSGHPQIGNHDTASVGIMAATKESFGITGIAYKAKVGYSTSPAENLFDLYDKLMPGDVIQVGIQTDMYLPLEVYSDNFVIYKAFTDKGVHVIEAAGNGSTDLDNFNISRYDSGAIMVGAVCAENARKASFSNYGKRIDSSSWGCWDVVTTTIDNDDLFNGKNMSYTSSFSGTSSANPIIAGVVASLSGIAKAYGLKLSPKDMRRILKDTGTVFEGGDSSIMATQPDLHLAIHKAFAEGR